MRQQLLGMLAGPRGHERARGNRWWQLASVLHVTAPRCASKLPRENGDPLSAAQPASVSAELNNNFATIVRVFMLGP